MTGRLDRTIRKHRVLRILAVIILWPLVRLAESEHGVPFSQQTSFRHVMRWAWTGKGVRKASEPAGPLGLAGWCEHGVQMLDHCDSCHQRNQLRHFSVLPSRDANGETDDLVVCCDRCGNQILCREVVRLVDLIDAAEEHGTDCTQPRCSKCGGTLSPCDTCGQPSMCGDVFCTTCATD